VEIWAGQKMVVGVRRRWMRRLCFGK
jgi:hypothetical protein